MSDASPFSSAPTSRRSLLRSGGMVAAAAGALVLSETIVPFDATLEEDILYVQRAAGANTRLFRIKYTGN